jgi:hypothetical protein
MCSRAAAALGKPLSSLRCRHLLRLHPPSFVPPPVAA